MTGGAAAQAAGTVGAANAWTGALGGVAGAVGGVGRYYQDKETLKTIMNNPALGPGNYGAGNRYGLDSYSRTIVNPDGSITVRR
jgi:hypothetical protein